MFYVRTEGPAVACIPKNATQSLYMAMAPCDRITNEQALERDVRVMFIRDPFDRMASAYSFFSHLKAIHSRVSPPIPDFQSYEEFLDWALESNDFHVTPQVDVVTTKDGVFVPNRIHPFRELPKIWSEYFPGLIPDTVDFPHRHNCQRLATSAYRREDITRRFAKDLELCRQL